MKHLATAFILFCISIELTANTDVWNRLSEQLAVADQKVFDPRHASIVRPHPECADRAPTVLFMHGVFNSPYFFPGYYEVIDQACMNLVSLRLPGHFIDPPHDLEKVTAADWRRAAENTLITLRAAGQQVIVTGVSLGGLLAAHLASEFPDDVAGLFVMAPALRVNAATRSLLWLDRFLFFYDHDFWMRTFRGDRGDRVKDRPDLRRAYSAGGRRVVDLAQEVFPDARRDEFFARITAPTAMILAEKDMAVINEVNRDFYALVQHPVQDEPMLLSAERYSHQSFSRAEEYDLTPVYEEFAAFLFGLSAD